MAAPLSAYCLGTVSSAPGDSACFRHATCNDNAHPQGLPHRPHQGNVVLFHAPGPHPAALHTSFRPSVQLLDIQRRRLTYREDNAEKTVYVIPPWHEQRGFLGKSFLRGIVEEQPFGQHHAYATHVGALYAGRLWVVLTCRCATSTLVPASSSCILKGTDSGDMPHLRNRRSCLQHAQCSVKTLHESNPYSTACVCRFLLSNAPGCLDCCSRC